MIRSRRRVFVTGMGVVSPVGNNVQAFFDSLIAGRSGIRLHEASGLPTGSAREFAVPDFLTRSQLLGMDRVAQFGLAAAEEAIRDAALEADALSGARTGLYLGTSVGGAASLEEGYRSFFTTPGGRIAPLTVVSTMPNATAAHVSIRHGIRGPVLTYSVACASAAVAIGEAFRAVRDGYLDVAVAGGAEAMVTPAFVNAWAAMRVLAKADPESPERSCRPFSKDRSGIVLGEGAGILILQGLDAGEEIPVRAWAELAGYGIAGDAQHISRPYADGQVKSMTMALKDASLEPADIGYINAHGTATPIGDAVETAAVKQAFGDAARGLAVTSTKALHGHLMGAAGAVELIAAVMAMHSGQLPPTCHYSAPDPECDLDYVPNATRRSPALNAVMSNSFAFGGTNAALVAKRCPGGRVAIERA